MAGSKRGSRSTTPAPGSGFGARGGYSGRGRGRGGGLVYQDMSAMALDYSNKVNISDDVDAPQASTSQQQLPVRQQANPKSHQTRPAGRGPSDSRPFNHAGGFSSSAANVQNVFGWRPATHVLQDQPSSYRSSNSASPFQPNAKQPALTKGGIGTFNRKPDSYRHDPSLTRPVAFVKASTSLKPTMDKEQQDEYLAQQSLENLSNKAPSIPVATQPPPLAGTSDPLQSRTSNESLQSQSKQNSALLTATKLSGHSNTFAHAGIGFQKAHPGHASKQKVADATPSLVEAHSQQGDDLANPVEPLEPLFVIDTVGDVPVHPAQAHSGSVDISLTPQLPPSLPIANSNSARVRNSNNEDDEEEEVSDTEDLYPRRQLDQGTSQGSGVPAPLLRTEPIIESKSYARVIDDPISVESAPKPAPVQPLSAVAKAFVVAATSASNSGSGSQKVSKKEKLRLKKENRRERKRHLRNGRISSARQRRVPRQGDSDLEWGSDGPPGADDADSDEELDAQELDATIDVLRGKSRPANGARRGKYSAIDAALEDYMANVSNNLVTDEDEDDDDDDDDDAKDMIAADDLARLRAFAASMSGNQEHLTIADLEDIAVMQAEDESDDQAYEDRVLRKDFIREQFPVYMPSPDSETDVDDERNKIFKSSDDSDANEVMDRWEKAGREFLKASGTKRGGEPNVREQGLAVASEDDSSSDDGGLTNDDLKIRVEGQQAVVIVSDDSEDEEEMEEEDEEDEDEDDDIVLEPRIARKLSKQPGFMGDEFDEMLQKQWKRDREKKAIKRQERALKRLEKNPSKANSKKAKKAAARARSFKDDDDEDDDDLDESFLFSTSKMPDFHQINQDIRDFIEQSGRGELPLLPMDKKFRFAIHMLADAYNLKSKSRGSGKGRHNVLYRTSHTTVRGADNRKINKYLTITSTWKSGSNKAYSYERPSKSGRAGGSGAASGGRVTRNYEGAVVGEGADKIASDNIGHRMLAKMGWTEGMTIGKSGGIDQPIAAVIKTSKAGLGSGWVRYNRGTVLATSNAISIEGDSLTVTEGWGL